MMYFAHLAIEEGVVYCYTPVNNLGNEMDVTLNCDSIESRDDVLDLRAEKLRSCMQGIPVLGEFALILVNAYILLMSAHKLAALQ